MEWSPRLTWHVVLTFESKEPASWMTRCSHTLAVHSHYTHRAVPLHWLDWLKASWQDTHKRLHHSCSGEQCRESFQHRRLYIYHMKARHMCIGIYIIHTHVIAYVCAYLYIYIHICVHIHIHMHIFICTYTYTYTCTYTYTYTYRMTCACKFTLLHVYVYVCVCICILSAQIYSTCVYIYIIYTYSFLFRINQMCNDNEPGLATQQQ
jgi:hypothetical protein